MSMISMNDLFYGIRESVLILKDENRELLETIHRYNYFYSEPPPKPSDLPEEVEVSYSSLLRNVCRRQGDDSEKISKENEQATPPDADEKTDGNEDKKVDQPEQAPIATKVVLKVPICCAQCEETATIVLKNVAGVERVESTLLKGKVTVTGTAAPADLLLACRDLKLFRKTRFWRDDID